MRRLVVTVLLGAALVACEQRPTAEEAVAQGDAVAFAGLLDDGLDSNLRDVNGQPLLYKAAKAGHADIVVLLLDRGAEIDAKTKATGRTALSQAAFSGHLDVVELLLARGADIHARNLFEFTPLHDAAINGRKDVVVYLLAHGADPKAQTVDGSLPIDLASQRGHEDVVRILEAHGP